MVTLAPGLVSTKFEDANAFDAAILRANLIPSVIMEMSSGLRRKALSAAGAAKGSAD